MEHPKDKGMQGQWRPVPPSKTIPIMRSQPISSSNWLESLDMNGANNGQMGALEFDDDGLAQMPYSSLLAINDPTIVSMMNLTNLTVARSGGSSVGGNQRSNAELSNQNPMLVNGRMVLPPNRGVVNNQFLPSNRGDVNNQFLPLNRGDVNNQLLQLHRRDVSNQSLPLNREDVNNQFLQLNRGDVHNQSLRLNCEGVNRQFLPMTQEDIDREFLPTKWENINSQFMQSNHAHVNGRIRHPLAPKPQFRTAVPSVPNLNSLPDNDMASTFVGEVMAFPATPATVEKHQRERIHLSHEIIDLDSEETSTYHSGNLPQSVANNRREQCFSNRVEPSQVVPSQYQECERNVTVNSSEEPDARQNLVVNSSEGLGVQQAEGEHQDKDLNNTPQQKPKRKKHRPKVVREGKPARTPKATPKPPNASGNPSEKRKYVRRNTKGVNPQVKPSTTLEEAVDPNCQSRSKLVRRSLNFDLEDSQARDDRLSGSGPMMFRQNVCETQGRDAHVAAETVVSSSTTAAVHSPRGQGPMVLESSAGGRVGFDLNSLMNQFANENVSSPQTPIQPPQPSRQEILKAKWPEGVGIPQTPIQPQSSSQGMLKTRWQNDFAMMMSNMTTPLHPTAREGENLRTLRRMINCQNVQANHERHLEDGRQSKDVLLQGAKRDHGLLGASQDQANKTSVHTNNGVGSASENYYDVHKKRRTEDALTWACTPSGWKPVSSKQNTNKSFTFADAQRLMALEKRQSQNCMLLLNQIARTTNDQQVQGHGQRSGGYIVDINKVSTPKQVCNQPSTPERSPIYSNGYEKEEICGPKARVEVLVANQMKSKAGRRKKEDPRVSSMATNVNQMKHVTATCKAGSSPVTESEAQCSRGNYKASGLLVSYGDPMENLVLKLRNLNINAGHGNEGVRAQPQNALVPYVGGGGTMIPFEGPFELLKKRKPRAKVDLDPESNRVWKLLMGKEIEGEEGTDADKEKWWEEERRVFHGRADSFIARMHLIQGDRRFSRWKGSVVDSVIGVFLTQNVSDHLSSSAFMSLAARFPPKSKGSNMNANTETIRSPIIVSEPEFCHQSSLGMKETKEMDKINDSFESSIDFSKESSLDFHEVGQKSPDSVLGNTATVTSCASEVEGEDRRSLEDVISSLNSVDSSQNSSECPGQTTLLNFEAEELLTVGSSIGFNSFTELLQMANDRVLQDPKVADNGRVLSAEYSDGIDWSHLHPSNAHLNFSSVPSRFYDHSNFLNSGFVGMQNGCAVVNESNWSYLPRSDLNEASINGSSTNAPDRRKPWIAEIATCVDSCGPTSTTTAIEGEMQSCCQSEAYLKENVSSVSLNQQDGNTLKFQQRARESEVQIERTQKPVTPQSSSTSHNGNQRNNLASIDVAESSSRNEMRASQKVSDEKSNNASMGKKVKSEADKKMTFDWDSLRREACRCSAKKEQNGDALDSLDYEAVRQADVNEISHTIRERGMNNLLAERIKDFLNRLVRDHGSIDLEWLRDVPPDKAKDYLLSIRGLGLKSVECIRLLTLHHLAFPVDTNVGRICVRLGWVPLQPLPESLQLHLLEMYPMLETIQKYLWPRLCKLDQRTLYELHYQLITFGKVFCTKSKPNCNSCPMRGECKHFASAYASARLALPGPEDKRIVSSSTPLSTESAHGPVPNPMPLPQLEGNILPQEQTIPRICEPIIEEPATPEPECIETSVIDIEDAFYNDPDEIPTIKLSFEEFTQNLQNYMQENNMGLQDSDMSKALVAMSPEAASIPMPKLKNVNRLRTEHLVYELPDSHPILEGLDKREPDDPCPYLLAIWTPGETAQSTEAPKSCCNSQESGKLCDKNTCFSCNSIREAQAHMVRGTILIPCRTANRGSFPLNGTYFQVNEVFADNDSSRNPIDVPRDWIWNLPRRTVYFGTSIPSIFKGLTTEGIQHCFWRGFVCVRGFDRTMRAPKPLFARLHFPASKVTRNKRTTARDEE